jgi:choline dehydrogenase-like flavoprotein
LTTDPTVKSDAHRSGKVAAKVVVVGGSLSGLMTALALSRSGTRVTVLERMDEAPAQRRILAVDPISSPCLGRRPYPPCAQCRPAAGRDLRLADGDVACPARRVVGDRRTGPSHYPAQRLSGDVRRSREDLAWAVTDSGRTVVGQAVIGADGYRSGRTPHVAPDNPDI